MNERAYRLETTLFILILLMGAVLRFVALKSIPPGLTHDEADHGLDAAGVLAGRTPIYFSVGYGREPFYDYVTSAVMLIVGRNFLASRLTAALFGTALLVLVYAWVRRATQNPWLALATMAGLAVSFWGVSTSRQALRSITLPVLYTAASLAMWRGIRVEEELDSRLSRPQPEIERRTWFALAGIILGFSFYTYLASRIMWIVFPAFFAFLSISQPGTTRYLWRGLVIMLGIAALIAAPLAVYLLSHPGTEMRLTQLSTPIQLALAGDAGLLLQNIRAGLGMITVAGDDLWLYNVPGKPLLGPMMSLLFYLGISVAVMSLVVPHRPARRGRRSYDEAFRISSANAFMLLTLVAGIVPALITGVGASNTRVIGMQPALFYFPALAAVWLADWAQRQVGPGGANAIWTAFGVLIVVNLGLTAHSYFVVWTNARDVRVAYHTTLVETLRYLDAHPEIGPDVAISTIYPDRVHDPAIAQMMLQRDDLRIRWFDGRSSIVIPASSDYTYFFPEIASPDADLVWWNTSTNTGLSINTDHITLRPTDFNARVEVITVHDPDSSHQIKKEHILATADQTVSLTATSITPIDQIEPGQTLTLQMHWLVKQPTQAEIVFFTHVLDEADQIVVQQDFNGAPAWCWVPGDVIIQIHRLTIPVGAQPGTLHIVIGAYTRQDVKRLPLVDHEGRSLGDHLAIGQVEVIAP